jgi:hypothetical protein
MASFVVRDNVRIQAKIRLKGVEMSNTFATRQEADAWVEHNEREILLAHDSPLFLMALTTEERELIINMRQAKYGVC